MWGSSWEPLTAGLGSTDYRVDCAAWPGCASAAAENKLWGSKTQQEGRFGGISSTGALGVGTSTARSASPRLLHSLLCRRDEANPPCRRPGHQSREGCAGAGGAARRDAGRRVVLLNRASCQDRAPRSRVPDRSPSPFPAPVLSPSARCCRRYRMAAALRLPPGEDSSVSRILWPNRAAFAPEAWKPRRGTPGKRGTPQAAQPREASASRDRPVPGISGGSGEAAGAGSHSAVRGSCLPVRCPRPPARGPSVPAVGVSPPPQLAPTRVTPLPHPLLS